MITKEDGVIMEEQRGVGQLFSTTLFSTGVSYIHFVGQGNRNPFWVAIFFLNVIRQFMELFFQLLKDYLLEHSLSTPLVCIWSKREGVVFTWTIKNEIIIIVRHFRFSMKQKLPIAIIHSFIFRLAMHVCNPSTHKDFWNSSWFQTTNKVRSWVWSWFPSAPVNVQKCRKLSRTPTDLFNSNEVSEGKDDKILPNSASKFSFFPSKLHNSSSQYGEWKYICCQHFESGHQFCLKDKSTMA